MSYINDALHKVQNDKEAPYASWAPPVAAGSPKNRSGRTPALIGAFVALLVLAGGLALWWSTRPEAPAVRPAKTVQRPVAAATDPAPAALPAAREAKPAVPAAVVASNPVLPGQTSAVKKAAAAPVRTGEPQAGSAAPEDAESLYALALEKQREGRLREASRLYRRVLKKEPRHFRAQNNLGVVYLRLGEDRRARICFNDALHIRRDYADAHYNLACLYAQKNDTKQSLFYLKNAVDFNPDVRQWAATDKDLRNIAHLPEFHSIIQARDR
ncbi:MAG: tetratricopeptide repeat protein [Smithellaceae bacterium]|nr:tetratricopeptide repeat protein [Syntrophaceae bacterium]MDD4242097.1 tetratricopeptide repeat protein [Smithellaceae bacterium]